MAGKTLPTFLNESYEVVNVTLLKLHPRNANEGDFGAIEESITENDFYGAVLANRRTNHILSGNHRYKVLRSLGHTTIPVIWVDVDEERELRILVADNRTTRLGRDDETKLTAILTELAATDAGLAGTGYDGDDLDALIADLADDEPQETPSEQPEGERASLLCPKCGHSFIVNVKNLEDGE